MGIEMTNWIGYMAGVSNKGWKVDPDTPLPPTDEEVTTAIDTFRDAVLYLYNNTFRACGISVGDRQSECNAMKIYDVLCRSMTSHIDDALAEARQEELSKLEAEHAAKATELQHLFARIVKLREMTQ